MGGRSGIEVEYVKLGLSYQEKIGEVYDPDSRYNIAPRIRVPIIRPEGDTRFRPR
jgi:hypothetical protein